MLLLDEIGLYTPFLFFSLSLRLRFPLVCVCVYIAGLKKLWHVHIYDKETERKNGQPQLKPPPPPSRVRALISSLSFSLLSKDSRRGARKAHFAYTHSLCLSFLCPYIYLQMNVVKSKSFYRSQCVHSSAMLYVFINTHHFTVCVIRWREKKE
jgi:hypothetical protein